MFGVVIMRSAGCVLNDLADRNIDPYVERTRMPPIASGAVAPLEALTLFVALALIAVGLAAMLNRPAQVLAVIGAGLTIVYPFIKRIISIPQFVLGAAFGWAVPMAFAAQTGETAQLAWLMFGTALIWAVIYDTFYAMVDRDDDLKVGTKSTAILFGDADLFVIGGLQLLMLVALVFIGDMAELGFWYYGSIVLAAIADGLASVACPRPSSSWLLQSFPAQSIHRHDYIYRHCPALHLCSCWSSVSPRYRQHADAFSARF